MFPRQQKTTAKPHATDSAVMAKEQGVATLGIAMILLFSITFIVLFSSTSAINEQRISANELRAAQAQAAADAGLAIVTSRLKDTAYRSAAFVSLNTTAPLQPTGTLESSVNGNAEFRYAVDILDNSVSKGVNYARDNYRLLQLAVIGCSDSCTPCSASCPAHRENNAWVVLNDVLTMPGKTPPAPLVVLNDVTLAGGVGLNTSGASDVALKYYGAGVTFNDAQPSLLTTGGTYAPSGSPLSIVSPTVSGINAVDDPDVAIQAAAGISAREDALHAYYFGQNATRLWSVAEKPNCDSDGSPGPCTVAELATHFASSNARSRVVWLQRGLEISTTDMLGSATEPVLIISNGPIVLADSNPALTSDQAIINGMLYLTKGPGSSTAAYQTWSFAGAGGIQVNGMLLVNGNLSVGLAANEQFSVVYNASVLSLLRDVALADVIIGSWK